uniref:ornithine decarboxylase antizyme-like n=1 Tax=Styela clava TaxID=7725 RepID=UPI001939F1D9|nr:ornithine decarboxylase antizyme-like [Styela clava]
MKKKRKRKSSGLTAHPSLGSAPDVPNKENYTTASFADELFGADKLDPDNFILKSFEIKVTENITVKWDTVIFNRQMFVLVPTTLSQSGSRDSFVALLEIAEEELDCEAVICCVQNISSEKSTQIRTFMYMGFQAIPSTSPLLSILSPGSKKYFFLGNEL